jgi:MoxR-like ATPase
MSAPLLSEQASVLQEKFLKLREKMAEVIVGQKNLLDRLLIGLLADGHLLLEGAPGLAKTLSVKTLASLISAHFKRIQFTPDLLPLDLLGTRIFHVQEGTFTLEKGPIFTEILLADEINRAPPKVQSALLEAMQEKQVTLSGERLPLGSLFLVLATQNPIEQEGTYPLPEAQRDRFLLHVRLPYPTPEEEQNILKLAFSQAPKSPLQPLLTSKEIEEGRVFVHQLHLDPKLIHYIVRLVDETRKGMQNNGLLKGLIQWGLSPRASLSLAASAKALAFLRGRSFVLPEDIKEMAPDVMRHRLLLTYEAQADGWTPDRIVAELLTKLPII